MPAAASMELHPVQFLHLQERLENMVLTSMLAGNIPGKTATISQRIAMVIEDGDYQTAGVWVGIVILIAFGIVVLMNLAFGKGMKHTKQW